MGSVFSSVIGSILGSIVSLIGSRMQSDSIADTNATNKEINDENLAYNKYVQDTTWQREDTSWQRGVADAEAAGLSPLAVSQGSTSGSVVGAPSAIPMQADNSGVTLMEGMLSAIQSGTNAVNDLYKTNLEHKDTVAARDLSHLEFVESLSQDMAKLDKQIEATADENTKDRLVSLKQFLAAQTEAARQFNATLEQNQGKIDREYSVKLFDAYQSQQIEDIKQQVGSNYDVPIQKYIGSKNKAAYQAAVSDWIEEYYAFQMEWANSGPMSMSNSYSEASSESGSSGLSAGASIVGTGANLGFNRGDGYMESESGSMSQDRSGNYEQALKAFLAKHPYPYYSDSFDEWKSKNF